MGCDVVDRWEEVLGGKCRVRGCVDGGVGWSGLGSGVWFVGGWGLGSGVWFVGGWGLGDVGGGNLGN